MFNTSHSPSPNGSSERCGAPLLSGITMRERASPKLIIARWRFACTVIRIFISEPMAANLLASIPAEGGQFDFLFWGAVQNGSWGTLDHNANAVAEGGYQARLQPGSPWIRGRWFRGSGDNDKNRPQACRVLPIVSDAAPLRPYSVLQPDE
jgi:hypothetical protein